MDHLRNDSCQSSRFRYEMCTRQSSVSVVVHKHVDVISYCYMRNDNEQKKKL